MTRETKIGLIVGLGVIIFIGILISDYLSVAQRQQSADINELAFGDSDREQTDNPYNLVPLTQRDGGEAGTPETRRRDRRDERRDDRFEVDQLVINTRDLIPDNDSDRPRRDDVDPTPIREHDRRDYVPYQRESQTQDDEVRIGDRDRDQGDDDAEARPRGTVHHVGRGESLWKIAAQHYGDSNLWRVIHEANRDKVPDPAKLRQGVALTIPPREQADRTGNGDSRGETEIPEPTETRTYTIRRGDSLSKIAERVYGSQRDVDRLLELNRDIIDNPDRIVVGMAIRVPAN